MFISVDVYSHLNSSLNFWIKSDSSTVKGRLPHVPILNENTLFDIVQ